MSIPKIMGTEIEYGIYVGNNNDREKLFAATNEMIKSCSSGFTLLADDCRKSNYSFLQRKDLYGDILSNGSRFYIDHCHPEFSTPECLSAKDLVTWEKAGEKIVEESRKKASQSLSVPIIIYKDSCDRKGHSFGAHENYLLSPKLFEELIEVKGKIAQAWISFLVTRQIWAGAGKITQISEEKFGYQISQRADFIRAIVSSDTMIARAIINSRNIPYADPKKFRRLHVIIGDANMSEYALWLKVGLSAFLLEILEKGSIPKDLPILKHPVYNVREISKDLALKKTLELADGRQMTALQIQEWFLGWLSQWYSSFYKPNKGRNLELEELLKEYQYTVDALENNPIKVADRLDCWIKLNLLENYRTKHNLPWSHWRVQAIDLAYHKIEKEKSVFYRLQKKGKIKRIVTDEKIEKAILEPPTNTRAYFRSFCLKNFPEKIRNVGWDYLRFKESKIPLLDCFVIEYIAPFRGTKKDCDALRFLNLKEFKKALKKKNYLRVRSTLL